MSREFIIHCGHKKGIQNIESETYFNGICGGFWDSYEGRKEFVKIFPRRELRWSEFLATFREILSRLRLQGETCQNSMRCFRPYGAQKKINLS